MISPFQRNDGGAIGVAAKIRSAARAIREMVSKRDAEQDPTEQVYCPVSLPDLFSLRSVRANGEIAVVAHIFYPDLLDEVLHGIRNIDQPFDLFVSLVQGSSDHLKDTILAQYSRAHIFVFPNRGRDVLPFMALASSGVLFNYDVICKIHTKKSAYRDDGDRWRRHLISSILGDTGVVAKIISRFRADPDLGIVVADGEVFEGPERWSGNTHHLRNFLPFLGATFERASLAPFAGGSIFWIRSCILRDVVGAKIPPAAFEPEPIGIDGTVAHAVERLFSVACHNFGMRVEQVSSVLNVGDVQQSLDGGIGSTRVIAFYLPQFHPIEENNEWWGEGFTEWTNVTKARPLYDGHRQPKLPGEIGFTDLRLPEVREQQASLAKEFGISGFCYYYYWFGLGKKLLQRPLDEVLKSGEPDFPFMICWANEPWSRNWDGGNKEVLVAQDYPNGWVAAFARDIAPLLKDPRYIKIGKRSSPVLFIYRLMSIPSPKASLAALRNELRKHGIQDIHISGGWFALGSDSPLPARPENIGLDSYFEFPPHNFPKVVAPTKGLPAAFCGRIYDYAAIVDAIVNANNTERRNSIRHRAAMMGWDNTARRQNGAHVYRGATPGHFRRWLRRLVTEHRQGYAQEERFIFVNAWNEWAEGTCLEPDIDFGRGWLEAVRSALGQAARPGGK